jgi:prevent-host-death family protein
MSALEWARSDGHNDHMKRAPLKLPPDTVGVADAKRDLTKLIDRVLLTGKPVTIARRGKAVVRLVVAPVGKGLNQVPGPGLPDDSPFWAALKEVREWRLASQSRSINRLERQMK